MLVLIFGNTMLAASTVLTAYMAGLAAGSFFAGKYIDKKPRPLIRIYALLEGGIGLFALAFPFLLKLVEPVYTGLYATLEGNNAVFNLVRFVICFLLILIPTFLMGATLPVLIKRFVKSSDSIGREMGILYGLNTAGAVVGSVACGFLFLGILGMKLSTLVGIAVNLSVALAAWLIGKNDKKTTSPETTAETPVTKEINETGTPIPQEYGSGTVLTVMIGTALSGFCALAYEVLWTRMLNLFFHNTVYSFTTILATFLTGIALGSFIYSKFFSRIKWKVTLFVILEIGIGIIAYLTPFVFTTLYEVLFSKPSLTLIILKAGVIIFLPTLLMGMALPLAIQICQRGPQREGRSVGTVYAVNTLGSILGSFAAGFVFVPLLGIHKSVILVAGLNLLAGLLAVLSFLRTRMRVVYSAAFIVLVGILFLGASTPLFYNLYQAKQPTAKIKLYKEGKVANVLVYDFYQDGYKDLYLNGIEEASSRLWHVQLFKVLGILPAMIHDNPDNAVMIAFGAGMSAGACAQQVKSLECAELNPDIHQVAEIFKHENLDVIHNPHLKMVINDGRNHILLTPRKYSLIISDATNPLTFDSWTLYTKEFYEQCKKKLKPGGIFCQWVPIPLPNDAIKVILNTFRSVFPHMSFWCIYGSSQCLMLGTPERLKIDYRELSGRLNPILKSSGLEEFGVDSVEKFLSFFLIGEDKLNEMFKGFDKINTDDLPQAHFYPGIDTSGFQTSLDMLKYQESIMQYLTNMGDQESRLKKTFDHFITLSQFLNCGFLFSNDIEYKKAAIFLSENNLPGDKNVTCMLKYDVLKKEYFVNRVKQYPGEPTTLFNLGFIDYKEGKYDRAIDRFKQAIKLDPDFTNAYMSLAYTYIDAKKYDEAVEMLMEAKRVCPAQKIINKADTYLTIVHLLRKLEYLPGDKALHIDLVRAYLEVSEFAKAAQAIDAASIALPQQPELLELKSSIYENLELLDKSEAALRKLAELFPAETQIKEKANQLAQIQSDPQAKLQWFSNKITIPKAPQDHPEECSLAVDKWDTFDFNGKVKPNDLREAAALFEKVIKKDPKHMHAYSDAAIIYEALGQFAKASALWEKGLENSPGNTKAISNKNRLKLMEQMRSEKFDNAQSVQIYDTIGLFYFQTREFDNAVLYYKKVLELDPQNASAFSNLGANYIETGQFTHAVKALEDALKWNPNIDYADRIKASLQWLKTTVEARQNNTGANTGSTPNTNSR